MASWETPFIVLDQAVLRAMHRQLGEPLPPKGPGSTEDAALWESCFKLTGYCHAFSKQQAQV